jgi:hypothetical protein
MRRRHYQIRGMSMGSTRAREIKTEEDWEDWLNWIKELGTVCAEIRSKLRGVGRVRNGAMLKKCTTSVLYIGDWIAQAENGERWT